MIKMSDYVWEVLRPLSLLAEGLSTPIKFLVFFISIGLAVISLLAYLKHKESKKFLFLSGAFALFALKWLLKLLDIFISPGAFYSDASENFTELFILGLLFSAIFIKK